MTAKLAGMRRASRRRRVARLGAAVGLLLVPVGVLAAAPSAAAERGSVTAPNAAEAWYSTQPVSSCDLPLGCLPTSVPVSPYPDNTLHVGAAGGRETARTYVVPQLSGLPAGASAIGGTMTLPVATGTLDGTARPDAAAMQACLVLGPVTDGTAGSTGEPPPVDCEITAPAKYDGDDGGRFTVDLTRFLQVWSLGVPANGIALVPDLSAAGPSTVWHVTFNGREREGPRKISSTIRYVVPEAPAEEQPVPTPAPSMAPPPPADQPPPLTSGPGALPPVEQPDPTPAVATPPPATVAVSGPVGFQYPAAFLLPLAFLAAAVFLFRLFTSDPTPLAVRT